ncbi:universal stress protein [Pseudorhodoferax sp. LjRoot39]|uniref:universal stress protein n=1 Tax=Pseudorhodoferax sp. LjRoot39 TaxID=3342328 RepID=UPI003ECE1855
MYQRILVATDGSELFSRAVDSAIALAGLLKAELFALKSTCGQDTATLDQHALTRLRGPTGKTAWSTR